MLQATYLAVGSTNHLLAILLDSGREMPRTVQTMNNHALSDGWLEPARTWHREDRVLDVGCGYSELPARFARRHGCEVWGLDDFGRNSNDLFWLRGQDPDAFVASVPEVRFVFERLGDPARSSLEPGSFDVILTNNALHVAPPPHAPIWRHAASLLNDRPGSEIAAAMVCNFASDGAPEHAMARLRRIGELEDRVVRHLNETDRFDEGFWAEIHDIVKASPHRQSPLVYVAYMARSMGVQPFAFPGELRAASFCTQVAAMTNPVSQGFRDFEFSGNRDELVNYRHGRYSPVLIRFARSPEEAPAELFRPVELALWQSRGARFAPPPPADRFSVLPDAVGTPFFLRAEAEGEGERSVVQKVPSPGVQPCRVTLSLPVGTHKGASPCRLRLRDGERSFEATFDPERACCLPGAGGPGAEITVTCHGSGWSTIALSAVLLGDEFMTEISLADDHEPANPTSGKHHGLHCGRPRVRVETDRAFQPCSAQD